MSRPAFIDTNALVYVDQAHSAFHLPARAALGRLEQEGAELWISRQVLREYLATVTRPGSTGVPAMTRAAAADAVDGFVSAYRIAEDGQQTMARLLELVRTVPWAASRSMTPTSRRLCWRTASRGCSPSTAPTSTASAV